MITIISFIRTKIKESLLEKNMRSTKSKTSDAPSRKEIIPKFILPFEKFNLFHKIINILYPQELK